MNVKVVADTRAYIEGMQKVQRAIKKQRRRERIWNTVGVVLAVVLVAYILITAVAMIAGAAW